jgi:hypothetical protein
MPHIFPIVCLEPALSNDLLKIWDRIDIIELSVNNLGTGSDIVEWLVKNLRARINIVEQLFK